MPDSVSNSDIDAILRRQISSVAAQEKCERNDPNEISAYLEGALSSKRVADFEQHLVNCGICRRAVVELRAFEDESDSPATENAVSDAKTDTTSASDVAPGIVERLRRLLFGSGGTGYMWRPAAALVMILLIVAAPAVLFMRQSKPATNSAQPAAAYKYDSAREQAKPVDATNGGSAGYVSPGAVDTDTNDALRRGPSAAKTVQPEQTANGDVSSKEARQQPAGVAGQPAPGGPPADSPAAPPPPPPAVVASAANKDVAAPKTEREKQARDEEADKVRQIQERASASNMAYGAALNWNVTVSMTPVENSVAFSGALSSKRGEANSPDRSGGARGSAAEQPPSPAKSAPATRSNEDKDARGRADDAKRKEDVAKKPEPTVPYDKRVGQILKARFDKLMEDKVRSGTGITVRIRVRSDGTVISLNDGKVQDQDILKRSSNDVVNTAVFKAVAEGKLPAFGDAERAYPQIILVIKFEPSVN